MIERKYFKLYFYIRVVKYSGQYEDFFSMQLIASESTGVSYMAAQSVKNLRINIPDNEL